MASNEPRQYDSESDDDNFNPAPADLSDAENEGDHDDDHASKRIKNARDSSPVDGDVRNDEDDEHARPANGASKKSHKEIDSRAEDDAEDDEAGDGEDEDDVGRSKNVYDDEEDEEEDEEDEDDEDVHEVRLARPIFLSLNALRAVVRSLTPRYCRKLCVTRPSTCKNRQ